MKMKNRATLFRRITAGALSAILALGVFASVPLMPDSPVSLTAQATNITDAIISQLGSVEEYYFFDNSETQFDTVGAYWWDDADISAGDWPGVATTQIVGTDIWAI